MSHKSTQNTIRRDLDTTFGVLDCWFDCPKELLRFVPDEGWSIPEVLEHITLTNRFLLLTLDKKTKTALRRADRGDAIPDEPSNLDVLHTIGIRGSFDWDRPDHMVPTGADSLSEVRERLKQQRTQCHEILDLLDNGVGKLVMVSMSVNDLGKIDLNQWLYFIVCHAKRHLDQLESIRTLAKL